MSDLVATTSNSSDLAVATTTTTVTATATSAISTTATSSTTTTQSSSTSSSNANSTNSTPSSSSPLKNFDSIVMENFNTQDIYYGKQITAQFTDTAVLVYQAFNRKIGEFAVANQSYVGCPTYNATRMTWIKTNFTWMMFRNDWGRRHNQEMTLGIWLKRSAFLEYLRKYVQRGTKLKGRGRVLIQWDPWHLLDGTPIKRRRAIQIGLKGVETFTNGEDILAIVDLTDFVASHNVERGPKETLFKMPNELIEGLEIER